MKKELKVFVELKGADFFPSGAKEWNLRAFPRATFYNAILGQLFYVDARGKTSPGLIDSWSANTDHTEWTLHLFEGLRFHDGRLVRAEDVEFSFLRHILAPYETPEAELLTKIEGAAELRKGGIYRTEICKGLKILGEHTLRIKLKTPDPLFIENHALSELSIVPAEHLRADLLSWKIHPIGAGPYKVSQVSADQRSITVVKANQAIFATPKAPQKIQFLSDPVQEAVDLVIGAHPKARSMGLMQVMLDLPFSIQTILFNYSTSLARNQIFRRAVHLAIDRRALARAAGNGTRANDTLMSSDFEIQRDRIPAADPVAAKALLAGILGFTNKITIPLFGDGVIQPWYTELAAQLGRAGLSVKFEKTNDSPLAGKSEFHPIELHGIVPDVGDPTVLYSNFGDGAPYGPSHTMVTSSCQILLTQAMAAQGLAHRKRVLVELARAFNEESRSVPLFEELVSYYVNGSVIKNLGESFQRQSMQFHQIRMK